VRVHPVDPTAATVVGRPVPGAEYWLCEGEAGTCAPPTVAVVLVDVLGVPLHSNAELKVRALSLELIGFDLHPGRVPGADGTGPAQGWTGMSAPDVAALCRSYGVQVEVGQGGIAELADRLVAGDVVVVVLETEQLRAKAADGTLPGLGLESTHALLLTGLDEAAGLVYLNSPVDPGGTGIAIPLAQFAAAWAAAGHPLLRADLPEHGGLSGWPRSAPSADPWAGLGETVDIDELTGPVRTRRLTWLPFAFAALVAHPA
jgi:hypothetical protein